MRSLKSSLLWSAVILLVITASANADYQLFDLGTLGGTSSCAYSINNSGQIVGSASDSSGTKYACLFDSTGAKVNKNIAPIVSGSRQRGAAYSINNNGQIVGTDISSSGDNLAYLFDSTGGGGGTNLGTLPGFTNNEARAINDNGWIVGDVSTMPGTMGVAARFSPSPNTNLGTLGGSHSNAYAINNNGKIVGGAADTSSSYYACIFDSTGGGANIGLGTLEGYNTSKANSINNLDDIVGWAFKGSPSSLSAVLFDSTGGGENINLGALDYSYNQSQALSINDLGQIVGSAFYSISSPDKIAVLFDPKGHGNNIDLNTLVTPPSGWWLSSANCINNNGWIVGEMTNGSYTHAFLLTPEPATALLFTLGGVPVISGLRKRRS